MIMYPNRMHVVSIEGTGINTMEDLKGKRVSTGSPGSATEVMAFRVIEAAGLDKDKDMTRERLGVAESVNAIKDKKIDAFFWVGGLPTAAVTDLAATPGVKIKMIDHRRSRAGHEQEVRQSVFGRHDSEGDLQRHGEPTTRRRACEHAGGEREHERLTAYNIVKTLFEKRDELIAVHKEARELQARDAEAVGQRRFRFIRARSSISRKKA